MEKDYLTDKSLSWKAKGLLSYMLSVTDVQKVSVENLSKISASGKDATRSALVELEKAGYLRRVQAVNEKGQYDGYDYHIFL